MGLFSMSPTRQRYIRRFSRSGKGFGVTDRFLYEKLAKKMKACGDNLSPANYSHHIVFAKMTATPCNALIVSRSWVLMNLAVRKRWTFLKRN